MNSIKTEKTAVRNKIAPAGCHLMFIEIILGKDIKAAGRLWAGLSRSAVQRLKWRSEQGSGVFRASGIRFDFVLLEMES